MLIKLIKIFFSISTFILFIFLVNVTFNFSDYSKNLNFISKIALNEENDNIYKLSNSGTLSKIKTLSGNTSTGIFIKNINKIDNIYFSKLNSYKINYSSGIYEINLEKGLYFLDLNDFSVSYKIKALGFEIIPKSAGMLFIDTTNSKKTLIFSINSIYKFIFKSRGGRKVNYYYMYPHNYILFNIENNTFSRIGGDVFRIKTIITDGFIKDKIKSNLELNGLLNGYKLKFLENTLNLIKSEYNQYNSQFNQLKTINFFSLIGQKYINKYFIYFINESKKRIYYKQSILNSIQNLYNKNITSTDVSKDIITKLEKLKRYNIGDYNDILAVLNGYYKLILKNNSLEEKVILDNFLPLIKYLKLVENGEIKNIEDLIKKIKNNQNKIFIGNNKLEMSKLLNKNLDYLYLLRNLDKDSFNKIIINLQLKYNRLIKNNIINNKNLLNKYYYGVINLKEGNDDLELYILLKNIYFLYDFGNEKFNLEKYFNNFVNIYFSKLKIINGEIIVGQHIDIILLKSFLYYLEDYLNNYTFNLDKQENSINNSNNLIYKINILEKYLFLNKYIYFNNSSNELLQTGILKNKYLLKNVLIFIRQELFKEKKENNLLITLNKNNLSLEKKNEFSSIIKEIFKLKDINKNKIKLNGKFKTLLEEYDKLYKIYKEYFIALLNYEDYITKYSKTDKELDNYEIKINEYTLGKNDIIEFLSQFNGANFSNTKIIKINNTGDFSIKNFKVNGKIISFKLNPEKGYTISELTLEDEYTLKEKKKFFNNIYSLVREKKLWIEKQNGVKENKKENFNFQFYFKNKFFNNNITNNNDDIYLNKHNYKDNDSENIRIFKRDKLLGRNGEFSIINDILNISYNNIIVKDLKNIFIKNAKVLHNGYTIIFSSKYVIDIDKNKHYFYNENGINMLIQSSNGIKNSTTLLGGNTIKFNSNIELGNFRNIFLDIFNNIKILNDIINYINENNYFGINKVNIIYENKGNFNINFIYKGKKIDFKIKNGIVTQIKNNNIIINNYNGKDFLKNFQKIYLELIKK